MVLATGCAATSNSPLAPASSSSIDVSRPSSAAVPSTAFDGGSIDRVADTVCAIWFGWNTVSDSGPIDASLRAVPLLDPGTVTDLLTHPPSNGPGAEWLTLAATRAAASVTVVPAFESGGPADSADVAYRLRVVTQTFVGDAAPVVRRAVVGVVLRRAFDGWRVVSVAAR